MARRLGSAFKTSFYAFGVGVSRILLVLFFRFRIKGRDNVRPDETYVAVARHRSYWDILVVAAALGVRNRIHFIARKGLLKAVPLVQPIIRAYSTVIDRDNFGLKDFRLMLDAVKRERLVFIFPEGTTRSRVDAKGGAVYFALAAGKRILPINIQAVGPYPPRYPFRFPQLTVSIGKPLDPSELETETAANRSERLHDMSERLMVRVDNA